MVHGKIFQLSQIAKSVRDAIEAAASEIITTTYKVLEVTDTPNNNAIGIRALAVDANAYQDLAPSGAGVEAFTTYHTPGGVVNYSDLFVGIDNLSAKFVSSHNGAGTVLPVEIGPENNHTFFNIDGTITPPGPVNLVATQFFKSAEQTGNGAQQTIAHGLGRTPVLVIPSISLGTAATVLKESAAADATNVYITATNASKYFVWAT